ncbi:MAG TPA: DUF502 domain-containing protein [Burkholderiales bacterium]|jgi:uncharacterized membrane protein|nr:DUF502 domain-containing protein [Burkholderiales bacterium]
MDSPSGGGDSVKELVTQSARRASRIFLRGLVVVLPIVITLAVVYWLIVSAEALLGGIVRLVLPDRYYTKGLGVLLGVILIFAAGLTINVWITRVLIDRAEALMARIPIIKSIYGAIRDLAAFFSTDRSKARFHKVVTVTLGDGVRLVGFVTREDFTDQPPALAPAKDTVAVYLPMSYQIGGFTIFLPRSQVEPVDMSMEDAMRFTLTAGMSGANAAASETSSTRSAEADSSRAS